MSRLVETVTSQTAYATASLNVDFVPPSWARYAQFNWNISAVAGTTPIADCKLQLKDPVSGSFLDIDSGAFGQKTAASFQTLAVGPTMTADATGDYRQAVAMIPDAMRAVFTFDRTTADETYTFTLSVVWRD